MRFFSLCLTVFLLMILMPAFSRNRLVYYEPILVELEGVVKVKTLPGPPNYEDIKKGDVPETYGYLILQHPIDVDLKPNVKDESGGFDELEKNVKSVQLVVDSDKDWTLIKTGKHIQVIGTLFHRFTGHHHTRILIEIKKIDPLKI